MAVHEGPLGRKYPQHFTHVEKYALEREETPKLQPVAPGINWYENFDRPEKGADGKYRIGKGAWKRIRGGHCICECPPSMLSHDSNHNYLFYDQGEEGACEGFGHSRRYSILYQVTYHAFHLYEDAQRIEGTYEAGGGSADYGTTNDAVCQALKKWGVHTQTGEHARDVRLHTPYHTTKAASYKWATNAEQILKALGITDGGEIPILNSWGTYYPKVVYLAPEGMERLMREGGECDILTDV